jgi:arylsulfatase A-like enzyme
MYDNATHPKYPRHPGELRDMNDLRRMIDGYDCGIRYMDGHIGQVFDALERAGTMKDLVVIVSSDHGENLGELGIYGEHGTADHTTSRIPMIIRWPGKTQPGSMDDGLHYSLDLLPTLAELLGQTAQPAWDGQSYAAAIISGMDCGRDDLVVSQCAHVCQRGVRFGPWHYIRTYHDGYHLFPDEMLFNIEEDPHEQQDLAEKKPELCREAAMRLQDWHDRMMKTMPESYTTDPLRTVLEEGGPEHARGALPEYCKRLEATGRGWAIEELKKRHPKEFVK